MEKEKLDKFLKKISTEEPTYEGEYVRKPTLMVLIFASTNFRGGQKIKKL